MSSQSFALIERRKWTTVENLWRFWGRLCHESELGLLQRSRVRAGQPFVHKVSPCRFRDFGGRSSDWLNAKIPTRAFSRSGRMISTRLSYAYWPLCTEGILIRRMPPCSLCCTARTSPAQTASGVFGQAVHRDTIHAVGVKVHAVVSKLNQCSRSPASGGLQSGWTSLIEVNRLNCRAVKSYIPRGIIIGSLQFGAMLLFFCAALYPGQWPFDLAKKLGKEPCCRRLPWAIPQALTFQKFRRAFSIPAGFSGVYNRERGTVP